MLDFFKKLFRMIFGGGEQASSTENTAPSQESTGKEQAPEEKPVSGNG
ncbi:MAG: hypothetical protein AAGD28_17315 [Bacteroidota bacterium]